MSEPKWERCPAVCSGDGAKRFGYADGSRCALEEGHSVLRNGVGHAYLKWEGGSE